MTTEIPPAERRPHTRSKTRGAYRTRVTEKEREVYEMRQQGLSWAEIARRVGCNYRTAQNAYERAEKKMPKDGQLETPPRSLQREDPERYAAFVNQLIEPGEDGKALAVAAIAKRLNLPTTTAQRLAEEIRSVYFPTKIEARNIKLERLKDLWGMRAEEALAQLTPERIAGASPRDLAIIAGIATEKVLLLRGQPTQIIRTEKDRTKLDVLARAFIKEANRRGYEVKTNAVSGDVDVVYTGHGKIADAG